MPKPLPQTPTATADRGAVRVGAGLKLPPTPPASVADAGRVRVGAGLRAR